MDPPLRHLDASDPRCPQALGLPKSLRPTGPRAQAWWHFSSAPRLQPLPPPAGFPSPLYCSPESHVTCKILAVRHFRNATMWMLLLGRYLPGAALAFQCDMVFFKKAINRPPGVAGRPLSCSFTVIVRVTGVLTAEFSSLSCYGDPPGALFLGRPHHSPSRGRGCILKHAVCSSLTGRG